MPQENTPETETATLAILTAPSVSDPPSTNVALVSMDSPSRTQHATSDARLEPSSATVSAWDVTQLVEPVKSTQPTVSAATQDSSWPPTCVPPTVPMDTLTIKRAITALSVTLSARPVPTQPQVIVLLVRTHSTVTTTNVWIPAQLVPSSEPTEHAQPVPQTVVLVVQSHTVKSAAIT